PDYHSFYSSRYLCADRLAHGDCGTGIGVRCSQLISYDCVLATTGKVSHPRKGGETVAAFSSSTVAKEPESCASSGSWFILGLLIAVWRVAIPPVVSGCRYLTKCEFGKGVRG